MEEHKMWIRQRFNRWFFIVGIAVIAILGPGLIRSMEIMYTSGFDLMLGQIRLTHDSGGINSSLYVSQALLKGEVDPANVKGGRIILLPERVYFWDPAYLGFPEIQLEQAEALQILQLLQSGTFYANMAEGYECYPQGGGTWGPCDGGEELANGYLDVRFSAEREAHNMSLQIQLEDNFLAEYWLYPFEDTLAFEAIQPNLSTFEGITKVEQRFFENMSTRANVEPIPVLWDDLSAARANRIASRRLGREYDRAYLILDASPALTEKLGIIDEIRPAEGENWSSFWMDSSHMQLFFVVRGERGEGAVFMRGYECFDADLIFQGELYELFQGEGC
jgi:hypothetical protein